ncbi:MAG: cysteine methyltransferase [Desulfobulbaceae bacterium A2]|nr:MAG: cysteine methyltransferase [Desulfobulbaceae bacterium A2]
MNQAGYALFETSLGVCAMAWRQGGDDAVVTALLLPEATSRLTENRMAHLCGESRANAPPRIAEVIARVQKHLSGAAQDFADVPVALEGAGPFAQLVYATARKIPAGRTLTYGEVARAMGRPTAARAVGQALGKNPILLIIPCHRVLAAGNKGGGFSAYGGIETKARLLALEGTAFIAPRLRSGHAGSGR